MSTEHLAVVRGWADTQRALARWQRRPAPALVPWALASLVTAVTLLVATWGVATQSTPDPLLHAFPGIDAPATLADYGHILARNALVLALHALACVAGFIAGSSLPHVAEGYEGAWRRIHDRAGPLAILFVIAATAFSLATQAYALGSGAAALAAHLGVAEWELVVGVMPHALPELFALFLPLAAWTIASRGGRWHELLAATFVTVAIAVPILLASAAVELWVSPRLLVSMAG